MTKKIHTIQSSDKVEFDKQVNKFLENSFIEKDEEYEEEFCHECSKDWETSFLKPLCLKCFKGFIS